MQYTDNSQSHHNRMPRIPELEIPKRIRKHVDKLEARWAFSKEFLYEINVYKEM